VLGALVLAATMGVVPGSETETEELVVVIDFAFGGAL
jgi:hypothetical protein